MGHTSYRALTGRLAPFDGTPAPTGAPVTLAPGQPIPAIVSAILPAIGPLLKRLRTEADLTQEALAEQSGVSVRVVSDLERGIIRRPRRDTVQMLADGLRLIGPDRDTFVKVARRISVPGPAAAAAGPAKRLDLPLPPPPSALVGREQEIAETISLLLNGQTRLLTLTGPGGVGKTRLAIEVASRAREAFPDGAAFVDLAPLRDPALVLPAIARALGVRDDGALARSLHERLVAALAGRRLLLTLDNCEHLTAAAIAIADLLAACPTLTVLATSRQPLRLRIEHVYEAPPLALPDLDHRPPVGDLARIPAVDLFVRRAEAACRGFALTEANAAAVAEIAVKLDGLPLALELAAARMKVLSPTALLARLGYRLPLLTGGAEDLPARQQTLRATIEWSHDLLTPSEQTLFRSLAVFVGGFTIEAAEFVSRASRRRSTLDARLSTLDSLSALIDKSLVYALDAGDERRFGMLETIREFGLERLAAAGEEAELRRRHAAWCLDLATRAEPELAGADQARWLAMLDAEHDNLRAALGWAHDHRDAESALHLGGALHRFWNLRGHYAEGRRWLEQALASAGGRPAVRAKALLGAGLIAHSQGDYARAQALHEEALACFRALGDTAGVAASHRNLGLVADTQGDAERATALWEEALRLYRALGDQGGIGIMLNSLGLAAFDRGDHERAALLLDEALPLLRAMGAGDTTAKVLNNRSLVAQAQGELDRAAALQEEALNLWWSVGNKDGLAHCFENFAIIASLRHEPERVARLFGAAEALRARIGAPGRPNDRDFVERFLVEPRARLGAAAFAAAQAEGQAMPLETAIDCALDRGRWVPTDDPPATPGDD